MLKNLTILIIAVIAAAVSINAQDKNDKGGADETAIRANVEQLMKGWNAKSGSEFAKPFAEDADYVIVNGAQIKSRAVIDKGHQGIFETIYKNTTLTLATDSIRFLRADVAIVHVSAVLKHSEGSASRARISLVMTKTSDKWEIAAFQNTPVQERSETKK